MIEDSRKAWAATAIELVNGAFPFDSDDVRTWETCSKLLPHAFSVVENAEPLGVDLASCGRLLNQSGLYLRGGQSLIKLESFTSGLWRSA
jgi:hypothetical protein